MKSFNRASEWRSGGGADALAHLPELRVVGGGEEREEAAVGLRQSEALGDKTVNVLARHVLAAFCVDLRDLEAATAARRHDLARAEHLRTVRGFTRGERDRRERVAGERWRRRRGGCWGEGKGWPSGVLLHHGRARKRRRELTSGGQLQA
eukprot:534948-Pleurochrysis_carterae.AAC.2